MNNLWRKTILCFVLCWGATLAYSSITKKSIMADQSLKQFGSQLMPLSNSKVEKQNLLVVEQTPSNCQSIDTKYQEFYSFETQNYKISICLQGEEWFYYRESKSNPDSALLLPAKIVFGGDVFQAVDRQVTYFVGTNSDGYYSSVMYGNNEMIFEPELSTSSPIAQQEENLNSVEVSNSETIDVQDSDLNTGYWRVCTEDRDDLHPYLNGWQKFIGKSPKAIDEYATLNGHSFNYADPETESALVETTDGLMVSLDIIRLTETISSVCVKQIASF